MESFVYIFSLSPFSSLLREAVIMPLFQVENMRLRTVKGFAPLLIKFLDENLFSWQKHHKRWVALGEVPC